MRDKAWWGMDWKSIISPSVPGLFLQTSGFSVNGSETKEDDHCFLDTSLGGKVINKFQVKSIYARPPEPTLNDVTITNLWKRFTAKQMADHWMGYTHHKFQQPTYFPVLKTLQKLPFPLPPWINGNGTRRPSVPISQLRTDFPNTMPWYTPGSGKGTPPNATPARK